PMLAMVAPTSSSSLISPESYSTLSNATSSDSSSNTVNGDDNVHSNSNLSECLTPSPSTTSPSYFLLHYWTIICTYIANIFSKTTARHSTGEHAYMPIASIDNIHPPKSVNSTLRVRSNARKVNQASMTSSSSFPLMKTKTLILDLDETLIHSTSNGSRANAHMIEVMVDNHACLYHVYKRPHVDHFLKKVSEWYKVVIFTASMPEYADPVIDWLDPNKNLISNRFFRQSCTNRNGAYIKDLTIVEPDLSRVCIIDNSPISYAMHRENGIPIEGWISDQHDEALLDLLPFLDALRFTEDVRSILSLQTYKLSDI
ncbi:2526_t:CDS:2, partial [Acaulospora morrowiae]